MNAAIVPPLALPEHRQHPDNTCLAASDLTVSRNSGLGKQRHHCQLPAGHLGDHISATNGMAMRGPIGMRDKAPGWCMCCGTRWPCAIAAVALGSEPGSLLWQLSTRISELNAQIAAHGIVDAADVQTVVDWIFSRFGAPGDAGELPDRVVTAIRRIEPLLTAASPTAVPTGALPEPDPDHDTLVPGTGDDALEALSTIVEMLGCANTTDAIEEAIHELQAASKPAAPAPPLGRVLAQVQAAHDAMRKSPRGDEYLAAAARHLSDVLAGATPPADVLTPYDVDAAKAAFTEYFAKNYPGPNTIIGDPHWHAPKVFRAAQHAIAGAREYSTTREHA